MRFNWKSIFLMLLILGLLWVGCTGDATYPPSEPRVEVTVSQQMGPAPLSVGFNASVIAIGGDYQVIWYFGDDSDPEVGLSVAHVYPDPGDYTATCTVINDSGVGIVTDWVHLTCYGQTGPPFIP